MVVGLAKLLGKVLPVAQRSNAGGIASGLVRLRKDLLTVGDVNSVLSKYGAGPSARKALERAGVLVVGSLKESGDATSSEPEKLYVLTLPQPEERASKRHAVSEDVNSGQATGDESANIPAPSSPAPKPDAKPSGREDGASAGKSSAEKTTRMQGKPARRPSPQFQPKHQPIDEAPAAEPKPSGDAEPAPASKSPVSRFLAKLGVRSLRSVETRVLAKLPKAHLARVAETPRPELRRQGKRELSKTEHPEEHQEKSQMGNHAKRQTPPTARETRPSHTDAPSRQRVTPASSPQQVPDKPLTLAPGPRTLSEVPHVRNQGPEATSIRMKILDLNPRLWLNGWLLGSPAAYTLYEDKLRALSDELGRGELLGDGTLTSRELSYRVFGDEKFLERGSDGRKLLDLMGLGDIIRIKRQPRLGLLHYVPRRHETMRIVVSENLDPWVAVRDLMYGQGRQLILGERVHGVVFGTDTSPTILTSCLTCWPPWAPIASRCSTGATSTVLACRSTSAFVLWRTGALTSCRLRRHTRRWHAWRAPGGPIRRAMRWRRRRGFPSTASMISKSSYPRMCARMCTPS